MRSEEDPLALELAEGIVVDRLHALGFESIHFLVVVDDVAEAVEFFIVFSQLFFGVLDGVDHTEAEAGLLVYFDLGIHVEMKEGMRGATPG